MKDMAVGKLYLPDQSGFSRRRLLTYGAGALAAAALPAIAIRPSSVSAANKKVIIGVGGGAWEKAQDVAYFGPFQKETGIEVVKVPFPDLAKYRAMVQTGNVQMDISDIDTASVYLMAAEGILEPIDYSVFDSATLAGLLPEAKYKYGVGALYYSLIMSYRTDKLKTKTPATWADFWNTETFPNPRTLATGELAAGGGTFEVALLADGVPADKLYPIDFDRAFKSLDRIKDKVVTWWNPGAQAPQLLTDGQVDLASAWNGRIQDIKDKGVPVAINWNEGLLQFDMLFVLKGAPNRENAMKLLAFMSRAEQQAIFAQNIAYGPPNTKAYDYIPKARATILPTAPGLREQQIVQNYEFWNSKDKSGKKVIDDAIERWTSWVTG